MSSDMKADHYYPMFHDEQNVSRHQAGRAIILAAESHIILRKQVSR
jgi:hypothetical protein